MIGNDQELRAARKRITYFEQLLAQLRLTARPEEFRSVATGYRVELERMQAEVLDYLTTPAMAHKSGTIQASA